MKQSLASIFAVLTVVLATLPNAAQEVVQHRLSADNALMMPEFGAVATQEDGAREVAFTRVFPRDSHRGANVEQGDTILMMNGQRIRAIAELRELYSSLEEGEEIKLGLKRGPERFFIQIEKGDHQLSMGGGMRVVVAGGDEGEVELLHEARALLGERDGGVEVIAELQQGELREGDVLETLNGRKVSSLDEYREAYEASEIGEALKLRVARDEEQIEVEVIKEERPAGMMMMRSGG